MLVCIRCRSEIHERESLQAELINDFCFPPYFFLLESPNGMQFTLF